VEHRLEVASGNREAAEHHGKKDDEADACKHER